MVHRALQRFWTSLPWEVRLAYLAPVGFAFWLMLCVAAGPTLAMMLSPCLVYPALLVLGGTLYVRSTNTNWRPRVVPLVLVASLLLSGFVAPWLISVDLHVVCRVYSAGGPAALNRWAQNLLQDLVAETNGFKVLSEERIPAEIRRSLPSQLIVVDGASYRHLRFELGGGFLHYGVAVFPSEHHPPPDWFLQLLGWPPEVFVYHDDG